MSAHLTSSSRSDAAWPTQSWFLRGPLLSTVMVIASVAALCTEFALMAINDEPGLGFLGVGISAVGILVIFRARWAGLTLVAAGAVVSALFSSEFVGMWTVAVFAMFLFAKQGRGSLPAVAGVAVPLYLALVARQGGDFDSPDAVIAAVLCVAAAAAGSAVRLQNESWNAARERAIELAAAQAVELRRAVTDERLRIARDLHDVVGHELAVVNINVGVAEVSLPSDASDSRLALESARGGLQRTLQEMQQILDLLRAANPETDQRAELALLEHLPALVERVKTAGADVEARIDHNLPDVDPGVSAAAYRIVQESLTNAQKHGSGPALVTVRAAHSQLIIDVQNRSVGRTGSPDGRHRSGYGIVGMRERALSANGAIDISHSDDIFRVHVEFPTKVSPQ